MKHIKAADVPWTEKKGYEKKILLTPDTLKKIRASRAVAPHQTARIGRTALP